ncbi:MAG: MaoC family dehydratase [Gammaproteobacteria bacterium]|jgi:acyl dehydratase|nr:enoyl-CoA hydratase [Gammaproteobacteria bacterium]MBQ08771.1 enoyl-CoA hydratase [Gammaproteobacteria bacterium]MDP6146709.1 MaoC family dehydratase [Gammaproteobacteria bacterium]HJL80807.1 MaoC family dehydratase [Gammaproteobacteria bacterium]HJM08656.1 MaoC family dehydratase [Gammaproteobacteria bacterium]|tara:strand:+ start:15488 stop:15949 length:462 start_codon:yes stop_codon:yes gene_type:complete
MPRLISCFEDFKALEGQEIGVSDWHQINQDQINLFADATNDHQWIHVDEERAKSEMPGSKTIAHGYLILSMTPTMSSEFVQFENLQRAINYGVNKVRFTNMVPVNSRVRARSEVLKVRQRRGATHVVAQTTIEIENEDKPACVAETVSFYYFK